MATNGPQPLRAIALALMLAAAAGAAEISETTFFQDFREGSMHLALVPFGPGAAETLRPDGRGLRIRLPANRQRQGAVGVSPAFAVRGDFEITLEYQILKADVAPGINGVNVRIMSGVPQREAADLARYVMPGGRQVYFTNRVTTADDGEKKREIENFPTEAKSGRLRVARKGNELRFLVAEGKGKKFTEIRRVDFVAEDCQVRFAAFTGKGPGALDVRFVSVRIEAEALPGAPAAKEPWSWTFWLVIGAGAAAAAGIVAGGVIWWRRRRKH